MNRIIKLLFAGLCISGTACSQKAYKDYNVEEFETFINENKDNGLQLVDVRTAEEYAEGTIAGATLIDFKQSGFAERAEKALDKERPVAVFCRSGRRSANAAEILTEKGFKTVVNLKGGILAWNEKHQDKQFTADQLEEAKDEYGMEIDRFQAKGGGLTLHCIKHASVFIEYGEKKIYIDPVTRLGEWSTDYSKLPKADYIFITHEHGDHYDAAAIAALSKEGTVTVLNPRCAEMLGKGTAMKNGDKKTLSDGIAVEAVPAYNNTAGREKFHPKGRDNGYILSLGDKRIYIAGDTEDIEEMAQVKDIDIAFLPCNQPYTMTPEQLVRAAKTVKPKILFPYHYGNTNVEPIIDMLKDSGVEVRIRSYQ